MSGIPHQIILYKYRKDAFVQETGRITVNESLVFCWSNMFFWYALTISFAVTAVCVFVYRVVKNRRIKKTVKTYYGATVTYSPSRLEE